MTTELEQFIQIYCQPYSQLQSLSTKTQNLTDVGIQSCYVRPHYLNDWKKDWIGDFEIKTPPKTESIGEINTWPKSYAGSNMLLASNFDKMVWLLQPDGGYIFELEVPRYSEDEISVSIEGNTILVFGEKKFGEHSQCFTERYDIPYRSNLDLKNCLAKVKNGLLSIAFQKLPTSKAIKVL